MDYDKFNELLDIYINRDKINHAYLVETNIDNRIDLAYAMVNKIMHVLDLDYSIDDLIVNNDLLILKTDLQNIKKEEIVQIKDKFMTKSIYSGKRIYIIEEAEKLNNSSANTLLKFLEEPDDNIIAILLTENRYNIIETILSRCQIIRYYNNNNQSKEKLIEDFNKVVDLAELIYKEKEKAIALYNKILSKEDFERKKFQDILSNMLFVYYDILQVKVNLDIVYCNEYSEIINNIAKSITFEELNRNINAVNTAINKNKFNANTKLVMDSLIIDSCGGVEYV